MIFSERFALEKKEVEKLLKNKDIWNSEKKESSEEGQEKPEKKASLPKKDQ